MLQSLHFFFLFPDKLTFFFYDEQESVHQLKISYSVYQVFFFSKTLCNVMETTQITVLGQKFTQRKLVEFYNWIHKQYFAFMM